MLTLAQSRTLDFIVEFIHQHQYAPTTREIAVGTGIQSRGVVYRYLLALQTAGWIELIPSKHRNIQLTNKLRDQLGMSIPLLGKVAAGVPMEAIENRESLNMGDYFSGPDLFALLVSGDSMIDLGILEGDVAICRTAEVADHGEIVVALVDGENATLKRIEYRDDHTIALCPANAQLQPIVMVAERVTIQGCYIGLMRRHTSS